MIIVAVSVASVVIVTVAEDAIEDLLSSDEDDEDGRERKRRRRARHSEYSSRSGGGSGGGGGYDDDEGDDDNGDEGDGRGLSRVNTSDIRIVGSGFKPASAMMYPSTTSTSTATTDRDRLLKQLEDEEAEEMAAMAQQSKPNFTARALQRIIPKHTPQPVATGRNTSSGFQPASTLPLATKSPLKTPPIAKKHSSAVSPACLNSPTASIQAKKRPLAASSQLQSSPTTTHAAVDAMKATLTLIDTSGSSSDVNTFRTAGLHK